MPNLTLERSIHISAPRERVFAAISEPEQLAQWLLPPALGAEMTRSENGTLSVVMFGNATAVAQVEAADPPRTLTSRTLPDGILTTTYPLAEEAGGTRVTVRLSGFEGLPETAAQERLAPSGADWENALRNLKAFVEGAELPHPEGFLSGMFGYRRQTPDKVLVERIIWINAPRERVWHAVTDPQQITAWFSPGTEWQRSALEPGGRQYVYDKESATELYTQIIEVVDPPRLYVTRSTPEPASTSTWHLEEEKGGTRLTFTYSGFEGQPVEGRHMAIEQNTFGFGMMLENLRALVEGRGLPYPGGF
jgi:uncharacterized protein YndB with AHSA1/START domain